MNFDELINFLEKRLKEPIPGLDAHDKMKPKLANGDPINFRHPNPPKESGVLILINNVNNKAHFPLIQRPNYAGVHSGQIALPGGKKESTDKNLFATALRETEEEIGVAKSSIHIIGSLSTFYVAVSNFMVLPVIGMIDQAPKFLPDNREVVEIINPKVSDLVNGSNKKEKELTARGGVKLLSPYFELENKTVWGATAMILSEFEAILNDFEPK